MYEVINEKLKLEACSIGDLTLDMVNGMLKSWNDGSSISTLTLFYLPKRDVIVFNRDHKEYGTYREFTETYLRCGELEREKVKTAFKDIAGMEEVVNVLDAVITYRKKRKNIFVLKQQPLLGNGLNVSMMKEIISDTEDHYISMCMAFQYGVIQGKRLERHKKRQSATA